LAALLTGVALLRPLGAGASPLTRAVVGLALALGLVTSALLASLRGRGRAEVLSLYAFLALALDALGQLLGAAGWPAWPPLVLFVGGLAVAEKLPTALGIALLATLLTAADRWPDPRAGVGIGLGLCGLVLAVQRALFSEKRRLAATVEELRRLQHGIDQLEEPEATTRPSSTTLTLRQVSEDGRKARQMERAAELDEGLARLVRVARQSLGAHAVACFDVNRERDAAFLRSGDGPGSLLAGAHVPLGQDPFAFVLERRQAFYATDFRRLLWALPWYRGEVHVGSLLAVPVEVSGVVAGVLVADRLEVQAFTGHEPELLAEFAGLAGDAIQRTRVALAREEMGAEFKAVYAVSRHLATLVEPEPLRRLLLRSARDLVALDAAAVVIADEGLTRYTVTDASGWAKDLEGRELPMEERTWTSWVLRSAEDAYLLDDLAEQKERLPILAPGDDTPRAESLLAFPMRARNRTLGALVLAGRRGSFDATAHRVLGILANQTAAALSTLRLLEQIQELALRDALTGLYNRRAFVDHLAQAIAREDRREGGCFSLLILDLDHFKRLNDTFGHAAGDAALRHVASVLEKHLRRGDQVARVGGEEFAVILPGTDENGALLLASRLREAIEAAQIFAEGARLSTSASLGSATWPADGKAPEDLQRAADRALYAAKQAGRNKVVAASSMPAEPAPTTSSSG
jgi:diguanylate cyclase (GGDEF)-like protein